MFLQQGDVEFEVSVMVLDIVKVLGAPCFWGCSIFSDSQEIPQKKLKLSMN